MGGKEYLQAIAIIEGAIQTLDEVNLKHTEQESIEYVYNKLLRLKREVEQEAKDVIFKEMLLFGSEKEGEIIS